jgi:hypothetical protein
MTNPSWSDFGTYDESARPDLWEGVAFAVSTILGPTGDRIRDVGRYNSWGTLTNIAPSDAWVVQNGVSALRLNATTAAKYATFSNTGRIYDLGLRGWSVSMWCRPTADGTSVGRTAASLFFGTSAPFVSYGIDYGNSTSNNSFTLAVGVGGSLVFCNSTFTSAINNWYHVVGTYDGVNLRVWINGVLGREQSETRSTDYSGQSLAIGTYPGNFALAETFIGEIADVVGYRRVLGQSEIAELYRLGIGGMYARRTRRRAYVQQAGFQATWARQRTQLIGGGLR